MAISLLKRKDTAKNMPITDMTGSMHIVFIERIKMKQLKLRETLRIAMALLKNGSL